MHSRGEGGQMLSFQTICPCSRELLKIPRTTIFLNVKTIAKAIVVLTEIRL